jgi:putative ATPase
VLLDQKVVLPDDVSEVLLKLTGGDVRAALNALELAAQICPRAASGEKIISRELIQKTLQKTYARYDKQGDMHYDTISAFIKSVRGSDPDAAVHYLARMLDAGEDPKFIARRLIVLAAEDIGNAAPLGLVLATSAFSAVTYIGMPEARIILSQVTTYLASAEKSNAAYVAISEALADVQNQPLESIPLHLRNAPTDLMHQLGYANGYKYPHDFPENFVAENYLPAKLQEKSYYRPTGNGLEQKLKEHLRKLWPKKSR